jgi:hypothetical protein
VHTPEPPQHAQKTAAQTARDAEARPRYLMPGNPSVLTETSP